MLADSGKDEFNAIFKPIFARRYARPVGPSFANLPAGEGASASVSASGVVGSAVQPATPVLPREGEGAGSAERLTGARRRG